jgi:hypothetical protein
LGKNLIISAERVKILKINNAGQIMNDMFSNEESSAVRSPTLKTIINNAQNCTFTFSRIVKLSMAEINVKKTETTRRKVGKFIQKYFSAIIN